MNLHSKMGSEVLSDTRVGNDVYNGAHHDVDTIVDTFVDTRRQSLAICAPLSIEDYGLQASEFASPPKWHLAHTTWFFETFLLKPYVPGYEPLQPLYEVLFNSYYNGIGQQYPRGQRGLLSRPSLAEILEYREHVDRAMLALLTQSTDSQRECDIVARTVLGIEHERQHQELLFTDLKYSLAQNPLYPVYVDGEMPAGSVTAPLAWTSFDGGLVETGHSGDTFCFDHELPRHPLHLQPYSIASRLVTNGEYQQFIDDGGYARPELWLADGWATLEEARWRAPLYWVDRDGQQLEYTLMGLQARHAANPVCHVSGYEADAYARWADARLPREGEWEHAVAGMHAAASSGANAGFFHPQPAQGHGVSQLYGECWQWTQSAYGPYPGYSASADAIGEYNGKFMSNQWVLRGGSCVTPPSQARPTYRNFFYPKDRWQFSGIRLAR